MPTEPPPDSIPEPMGPTIPEPDAPSPPKPPPDFPETPGRSPRRRRSRSTRSPRPVRSRRPRRPTPRPERRGRSSGPASHRPDSIHFPGLSSTFTHPDFRLSNALYAEMASAIGSTSVSTFSGSAFLSMTASINRGM